MENVNEVKIALIVGIIMITICLIAFVTVKSKNDVTTLDVKVYKLYEYEDENKQVKYEYHTCQQLSTDEQLTFSREVNKIYSLTEEDQVYGKQIKGNYKVISNGKTIAFDLDEEKQNLVYRYDVNKLYQYNSSVYEMVKSICE